MQDSNLSLADFGASSPRLHLRLRAVQVKAWAPAPQNSVDTDLTHTIICTAFEVHKLLGPAKAVQTYAEEMARRLRKQDLSVQQPAKVFAREGDGWTFVGNLELIVEGLIGVAIARRKRLPDDDQREDMRRLVKHKRLPTGLILNFSTYKVRPGRVENPEMST